MCALSALCAQALALACAGGGDRERLSRAGVGGIGGIEVFMRRAMHVQTLRWHASYGLIVPMGSGEVGMLTGAGRGEMCAAHLEIGRRGW